MVILNIPKIGANVNDFQNANNFLLIMNNLLKRFLVIVTSAKHKPRSASRVKLFRFTFALIFAYLNQKKKQRIFA